MKYEAKSEVENIGSPMTAQAFAVLGGGRIAYVKPVRSEDVHTLYPEAPEMQPGMHCLLYTSPSPRDQRGSRMPSSA